MPAIVHFSLFELLEEVIPLLLLLRLLNFYGRYNLLAFNNLTTNHDLNQM